MTDFAQRKLTFQKNSLFFLLEFWKGKQHHCLLCVLMGCLTVSFKQFWKYCILIEKALKFHLLELFLCVVHHTLPVSQWWRWLELFCAKISSRVPSVSRCSRTPSPLPVDTASVRGASHPTGMEDEGATEFISVPFARSPSANVRSFTSTEPWRKSRSSSSTSHQLAVQRREEMAKGQEEDLGRMPSRTLTWLWPRGQGRCQRASLLRWWPVSTEFRPQEHLTLQDRSSQRVQSVHWLPATGMVTRRHPTTHHPAGTLTVFLEGSVYVDWGGRGVYCISAPSDERSPSTGTLWAGRTAPRLLCPCVPSTREAWSSSVAQTASASAAHAWTKQSTVDTTSPPPRGSGRSKKCVFHSGSQNRSLFSLGPHGQLKTYALKCNCVCLKSVNDNNGCLSHKRAACWNHSRQQGSEQFNTSAGSHGVVVMDPSVHFTVRTFLSVSSSPSWGFLRRSWGISSARGRRRWRKYKNP